jgi:hypothetical protein
MFTVTGKVVVAIVTLLLMVFAMPSSAGSLPYNISSLNDWLTNSSYFNGFESVESNVFSTDANWDYTALAFESGNINLTKEDDPAPGANPTFTTANDSNFGIWDTVDFTSTPYNSLYFEDSNGPYNVDLRQQAMTNFFDIYRLTETTNELSWLGNGYTLAAGTIIVGFNDNGLRRGGIAGGDADFDDMIVAMSQVPLPSAVWLFGSALIGFMTMANRRKL